jgi:adenine-specific DNA-methyltransferase
MDAQPLLSYLDHLSSDLTSQLDVTSRAKLGQYFTPAAIACSMAKLVELNRDSIHILDAGAGIGMLSAACTLDLIQREQKPKAIQVTAYEVDVSFIKHLRETYTELEARCEQVQVKFEYRLFNEDFISAATELVLKHEANLNCGTYDLAVLNPPYKKINTRSEVSKILRQAGLDTTNLYAAFLWLAMLHLRPEGEIVSITPRSFCNGPYFFAFRKAFTEQMSIRHIHVFETRDRAFRQDGVLQENVIVHARKSQHKDRVGISSSTGPDDHFPRTRKVPYQELIDPHDPEQFIHIVPDDMGTRIRARMKSLSNKLGTLDLKVSTGKVVDFRAKHLLRASEQANTVPLIYPGHFSNGYVCWPHSAFRKFQLLAAEPDASQLIVPAGFYVLVKRFSSKEEKRRIVAAVYDPQRIQADYIGFENHLNYFHYNGNGLPKELALGLCVYLNSSLVDSYFRHFNGHTQVNATDLRSLNYPTIYQLATLGHRIGSVFPEQEQLDNIIAEELGYAS